MNFNYYYNQIPGGDLWRNNLIYTSLISEDKKTFVQWYHNDSEYHKGMNEVVDQSLMDEKWYREIHHLQGMHTCHPTLTPRIIDINYVERKIYLEIDGPDFWQQSLDLECSFDRVLPDWQDQMLEIFRAHKNLGYWKFSLHPSSYFVVSGGLKSINYFFTYSGNEKITIRDHLSHISEKRRQMIKITTDNMNINWDEHQNLQIMQILSLECFRDNYPREFIEKAKNIFV